MAPQAASPVDDRLYQRLVDLLSAGRPDPGPGHTELRPAVEQALHHEARLLDDRCYRDWLERFTDDCVYWVPLDPDGAPRGQGSFLLDCRRR
ncbi:MAG: aromatic-ring-hydroxylating dioxygenase, partial [Acidimicrobiaceae bacterium]|nr:aromatic-ring-hydroxylating dioxygenase [Acidimicrobiaceae bacterium]